MAESKDTPDISLSALLLISAMIGSLVWPASRLTSSRPAGEERPEVSPLGLQKVEARLWQDPFVALEKASTAEGDSGITIEMLRNSIWDGKRTNVLVLPIMVEDGSYAEDLEFRVRYRYAVVSALSVAHLVPEDEGHLGFVDMPWGAGDAPVSDLSASEQSVQATSGGAKPISNHLVFPFEWYRRQVNRPGQNSTNESDPAPSQVLVLWLPERQFADWPLQRIARLREQLSNPLSAGRNYRTAGKTGFQTTLTNSFERSEAELVRRDDKTYFRFDGTNASALSNKTDRAQLIGAQVGRIGGRTTALCQMTLLGPDGSTVLKKFLDSIADEKREAAWTERTQPLLAGLHIVSPSASTMDALLMTNAFNPISRLPVVEKFGQLGIIFESIACTQDQLARELIDELKLRGVNPANSNNHIVLISERDTLFGRMLPLTFAIETVAEMRRESAEETSTLHIVNQVRTDAAAWPAHIHQYGYLRGLDGQLPHSGVDASERGKKADRSNSKAHSADEARAAAADSDHPEGRSQMDYLPRLADRLDELNAELRAKFGFAPRNLQQIKAIGVLGSDVYDTLLVLQSLRERFPGVIFFTTDLDARLWHPAELRWSRNLLVASGYGLRLDDTLQRDVPPFRDGNQTAQYLACLSALKFPDARDAASRRNPRRFEIGRLGPVDLSNDGPLSAHTPVRPSLHPPAQTDVTPRRMGLFALVAVICCVVLMRLVPYLRRMTFGNEGFIRSRTIVSEDHVLNFVTCAQRLKTQVVPLLTHQRQLHDQFSALNSIQANPTESERRTVLALLNRVVSDARFAGPLIKTSKFSSEKLDRSIANRSRLDGLLGDCVLPASEAIGLARQTVRNFWKSALICFLGVAALSAVVLKSHISPDGERFSLLSGTSVWATEFIRLAVLFVCVFAIRRARLDSRRSFLEQSHSFDLPFLPAAAPRPPARRRTRRFRPRVWLRFFWRHAEIVWWRPYTAFVPARGLWREYQWLDRPGIQRCRYVPNVVLYLLGGMLLMMGLGFPARPYRGELAGHADFLLLVLTVLSMLMLTFFVVDVTRLCRQFVANLSEHPTDWPDEIRKRFAQERGATDLTDLDEWLDIQLIARRTEMVARLIYYPFIVLLLMIVARNHFIDNWDWPPGLIAVMAVNFSLAIYSALVLQQSASVAKHEAISALSRKLAIVQGGGDRNRIGHLERMLKEIEDERRGAFAGFLHAPVLRAVLIPLGGTGLLSLLENLPLQ